MWTELMELLFRRLEIAPLPHCASPACSEVQDERERRQMDEVRERLDRVEAALNGASELWQRQLRP